MKKMMLCMVLLLCLGILCGCDTKAPENSAVNTESKAEVPEDSSVRPVNDRTPMTDPSMPADNVFHTETDYQYSWGRWDPGDGYFQRTPDGLVMQSGGRLYILEEETAIPRLCCFRPDCDHASDNEACTAGLMWFEEGIQYLDGKLYCVYDEPGKTCFYSMDTDGSNRKLMIEDYPKGGDFVVHRGYIYSYYLEYGTSQNAEKVKVILSQTSLKDPKMTKTLWTEDGDSSTVIGSSMTAFGNYLLFGRYREGSSYSYVDLYSLDLQTGKLIQYSPQEGEWLQNFRQVGDRIIIETINDAAEQRFYSLSLTLEDPVEYPVWTAEDLENGMIYIGNDTRYLYKWTCDVGKMEHGTMEIIDTDGTVADTVDLSVLDGIRSNLKIFSDPQDDGYVFITDIFLNWGFHYFKKSDIGSGTIELKPLTPVCSTIDYIRPEDLVFDPNTLEVIYSTSTP